MGGVTEDEASKARTGCVGAAIEIVWVNANIPCPEMERGECAYYYRQLYCISKWVCFCLRCKLGEA